MANASLSQHTVTAYLKQILGPRTNFKIPMFDFRMVIGRSKKADIVSSDPNVSRVHCELQYSPTGWSIKDLGSMNGTFVNETRIPSDSYLPLSHGDEIYFGPASDAPEAYLFESVKVSSNEQSSQSNRLTKVLRNKTPSPQKPAIKRKVCHPNISSDSSSSSKDTALANVNARKTANTNRERVEDGYHSDSSVSSCESLNTRIRKLSNKDQKKKEKKMKFSENIENYAVPSTSSVQQPRKQEPDFILNKMLFLGGKSDDEDSESLLHQENDDDKDVKYLSPIKVINKSDTPCNSNSAAESALRKENLDLQNAVNKLKQSLDDVVSEKIKLQEALKIKKETEIDIEQKAILNTKEAFRNLLEDDMLCNICTELYIKPVVLGCCHTFCQHCINEWKKKKKQCPICRERIETQSAVLFIDEYVNKVVQMLDPACAEKRAELLKTREEMQQKKPPKRKRCKSSNRRRRNAMSGPSGRGNTTVDFDEVQELRDRINNIQAYSDDIQAYVDVIDNLIDDDYMDSDNAYSDFMRNQICGYCGRPHAEEDCPYE